jgi:membrane associated rhomboid family serine protease
MHATVIPIGTDQSPRRRPAATMALVAANAVAYLWMRGSLGGDPEAAAGFVARWGFGGEAFRWWQPVTYQFVHDPSSVMHLVGNMLFLWTFGSAVEGRMRWSGFLLFYLVGGVVAGLVQVAWTGGPVIGASGSVSAVTGAFIALYPRARVAVLFVFSVLPVPAMLLVALYFAADLLGALGMGRGGIGHLAHLAGTAYGLLATLGLVAAGAIRRTDMDLLFLLRQWRRRREMRRAVDGHRGAAGPWASAAPGPAADAALRASAVGADGAAAAGGAGAPAPSPTALARQAARAREAAREHFAKGDFAAAAAGFARALALAPAAPDADETRLMLAVIHVRKAPDPAQARAALDAIGPALPEAMRPLAAALREELAGTLRRERGT